jgi:hypothetical protein
MPALRQSFPCRQEATFQPGGKNNSKILPGSKNTTILQDQTIESDWTDQRVDGHSPDEIQKIQIIFGWFP